MHTGAPGKCCQIRQKKQRVTNPAPFPRCMRAAPMWWKVIPGSPGDDGGSPFFWGQPWVPVGLGTTVGSGRFRDNGGSPIWKRDNCRFRGWEGQRWVPAGVRSSCQGRRMRRGEGCGPAALRAEFGAWARRRWPRRCCGAPVWPDNGA